MTKSHPLFGALLIAAACAGCGQDPSWELKNWASVGEVPPPPGGNSSQLELTKDGSELYLTVGPPVTTYKLDQWNWTKIAEASGWEQLWNVVVVEGQAFALARKSVALEVVQLSSGTWMSIGSFDERVAELAVSEGALFLGIRDDTDNNDEGPPIIHRYDIQLGSWEELPRPLPLDKDSWVVRWKLAAAGGLPYLAYDYDETLQKTMVVKRFDGSNWSFVGEPGLSPAPIYSPQLVVDNGVVYAAFQSLGDTDHVVVKRFDGAAWIALGSPPFTDEASWLPSLTVADGEAYISSRSSQIKFFYGEAWHPLGSSCSAFETPVEVEIVDGHILAGFIDGARDLSTGRISGVPRVLRHILQD